MNETVLDVLMYLFENFSEQDYEHSPSQMVLREELLQAGFGEPEVDRALDWLEELAATEDQPFANKPAKRSMRMFSVREIRTDSMKTTFDMDCTTKGGGGFFSSWSLRTFSISPLSPET